MNPARGRGRGRARGGGQRQQQDYVPPHQERAGGQDGNRPGGYHQQQRRQQQGRYGGQQQQQRRYEQQGQRRPERGQQDRPYDSPRGQASETRKHEKTQKKESKVALEDLNFKYTPPKLDLALVPKPEPGKMGRKFKVVSNLFPLKFPTCNIFHYDVKIVFKRQKPPPDKKGKEGTGDEPAVAPRISAIRNREVVNTMLDSDEFFKKRYAVYDGMKNLYSIEDLGIGQEAKKFEVSLPRLSGLDPNNPRMDKYDVLIKSVHKKETNDNVISLAPLQALFDRTTSSYPQESVMALETILRYGSSLKYIPVGRSFFYPPHPDNIHPLGGGKEIWFGYHQSLRLGQWGPLVNLDVSATAFYKSGPLIEFVAGFLNMNVRDFHNVGCLRENDIKRVEKELKTLQIYVTHLHYKRKYRVLRLTRRSANDTMIVVDNTRMSVARYFENTYKTLQYPHLPCVQGNPENKNIFLPFEVCHLIEGQYSKKKLDDRQTAEMIKYTKMFPRDKIDECKHINTDRANFEKDKFVLKFELSVSQNPVTLTGRELPAPTLEYANQMSVRPKDGQWDIRGKQYLEGAAIKSWGILCYASDRFCNMGRLQDFAKLLCRISRDQGMEMLPPATIEYLDNRNVSAAQALGRARDAYSIELAVVVISKKAKYIYTEVKQAAELQLGMRTQCVLDENVVFKCNPALVSNLCQKINAKMGGVNNALRVGEVPPIMRKPVIVIGADVSHPSPGSELNASVAAVVGSLDFHPSRYAVAVRTQVNRDSNKMSVEVILDLRTMVKEILMAFYRHTKGKKPEHIIFYRDGVSEGQFLEVVNHEVESVRDACRDVEQGYTPGITFVVVQKRHHVRFMPEDKRDGGKKGNIPPGTVMDTEIVHPLNYDFFLCSHFGLQGTSRPCHYTVLHDDNKFSSDDMQKLTYYLCHTYARCTKSVSCPVPVQYAHLAAYRARHHLQSVDGSDSSTAGPDEFRPITEAVRRAVQVEDSLKSSMYFV